MAMRDDIRALADRYADKLNRQIEHRLVEMRQDDRSHTLIYKVLGISVQEGILNELAEERTAQHGK